MPLEAHCSKTAGNAGRLDRRPGRHI